MTDARGSVLVLGATGNQGGGVADRLLERGFAVRALARDPSKPRAQALAERGAEVVQGDMDDRESVDRAMDGVDAVFSVQNYWETGREREIAQGKAVADAARAAGVGHIVYSSVGGADRDPGVSHFVSKWEIEEHIRSLGLKATILRPVFLMENFNSPLYRGALSNGVLPLALDPDYELQAVACDDVGEFAVLALEGHEEVAGKALEIASDVVTPAAIAGFFAEKLGTEVNHVQLPLEKLRELNPEVADMFAWYQDEGYQADLDALRRIHPNPLTVREWIERSDWGQTS
jgi:uncharacterized protein YbjT (DUF2867 family)